MKINNVLICDDVRVENNGKHIFIGVYTGDILFESLPAIFSPIFWVEIEPGVTNQRIDMEVKFDAPGMEKPRISLHSMDIEEERSVFMILNATPTLITGPGELVLSLRPKGTKKWVQAVRKSMSPRST